MSMSSYTYLPFVVNLLPVLFDKNSCCRRSFVGVRSFNAISRPSTPTLRRELPSLAPGSLRPTDRLFAAATVCRCCCCGCSRANIARLSALRAVNLHCRLARLAPAAAAAAIVLFQINAIANENPDFSVLASSVREVGLRHQPNAAQRRKERNG